MRSMTWRRTLIGVCAILAAILAYQSFYFQELFFAFLLFAMGFLALLLMAAIAVGAWMLYARSVVFLATRTAQQGRHALPLFRALVLWLAPTVTKTAGLASAVQQAFFYPFNGALRGWLKSFHMDATHFREDAERAAKHLRLLLKQG